LKAVDETLPPRRQTFEADLVDEEQIRQADSKARRVRFRSAVDVPQKQSGVCGREVSHALAFELERRRSGRAPCPEPTLLERRPWSNSRLFVVIRSHSRCLLALRLWDRFSAALLGAAAASRDFGRHRSFVRCHTKK
jgi:hypothetical protein